MPVPEHNCFHCGEPVPATAPWRAQINGTWQPMCCAGCQAVAEAIVGSGLEAYYSARLTPSSPPPRPSPPQPTGIVDDPVWQQNRVSPHGQAREAVLLVAGMTCPACAWLVEQRAGRLPGVRSAAANYATRRMRVCWDDGAARLSEILAALAQLGHPATVYSGVAAEAQRRAERKQAVWRLFVAGLGMMQVMMYVVPVYLAHPGDMSPASEALMRWASFALTVPVMLYAAAPFFSNALRDLRAARLGMDVPVSLGIAVGFAASSIAMVTGGTVYFDSVTMFVFFLLGGRYLEQVARDRAARWIESSCTAAGDDCAERLTDYPRSSVTEAVAVGRLGVGDHVLVRRGAAIPADGVLESAAACVDESLLTGESVPVEKVRGETVIGGSVNAAGMAVVRVIRTGSDTTRAAIERLVDRAMAARPSLARLAERFASPFTAAVLLLAIGAFAYWWRIDHDTAVRAAVAVLIATCPCALALATPLALAAACARLAASGVIVASGAGLETLARVTRVVFDKTGTLTDGKLEVDEIRPFRGYSRDQVLGCAAALEAAADHPAARTLVRAGNGCPQPALSEVLEGAMGVSALASSGPWGEGVRLRIGSAQFAGLPRTREEIATAACGHSLVVLADDSGWLAAFILRDRVREEAREVFSCLALRGVSSTILSGDAAGPVASVAAALGVADARPCLTPSDKRAALAALQEQGEVVAMVGDGVNDAPVLAQAQCGISLSGGASLALSRADLVLRDDDLRGVISALCVSHRMRRIIQQNLWWALAYNLAAVPLAVMGLLPAWLAGLGMAGSSLVVVLNSCRLLPRGFARPTESALPAGAVPGDSSSQARSSSQASVATQALTGVR